MGVFRFAVTSFVTVVFVAEAQAAWVYPVDPPTPPTIIRVVQLNNPTVNEIQQAIAPKTRIDIVGTVDASQGDLIDITEDDVRLNFARATRVYWSGSDTWDGFVQVHGHRVDVTKLKMEVVSGSGRCRGVMIFTPATDVRIRNCEFVNIADGFVADGNWARVSVENTKFLGCTDWESSNTMEGGYGFFLEDDDPDPDHLHLSNVKVTVDSNSAQHGLRISKVQNILIENCDIGANQKRSMWAYGVENMAVRNSTFRKGSVMINLKPFELMTDRPCQHIRMDNCRIYHASIMSPFQIYCGKGTVDFKFRDMVITSTTSNLCLDVGWRSDVESRGIRWYDGSLTFNGQPVAGTDHCSISSDWSAAECEQLVIGPVPDPRDD